MLRSMYLSRSGIQENLSGKLVGRKFESRQWDVPKFFCLSFFWINQDKSVYCNRSRLIWVGGKNVQLSRPCLDHGCVEEFIEANVDALKLIQLGLTLSDSGGNLPGTHCSYVWEFNFRDFNVDVDSHNPDSIALLKQQGIDFQRNMKYGIDSAKFGRQLLGSRILSPMVHWITFHGAYDFGFLIKILTGRRLPEDLSMFMGLVNAYFGGAVYDMKHMMQNCDGLYGGLERVAKTLGVDRVAGKSHQAGSDSLLIMQTLVKLIASYFGGKGGKQATIEFRSALYGLN